MAARRMRIGALALALVCVVPLGFAPSVRAQSDAIHVTATRIEMFRELPIGSTVDFVVWRGGLVLDGPADVGGISGATFVDNDHLIMVTDRGKFISARLEHDQSGAPASLQQVSLADITNSSGAPLPPNYSRDAEAIDTIYRDGVASAVRVGFENLTRVADFDLDNLHPIPPAREVAIPDWLSELRTNQSIESVCIAPPASPIAGSTLLVTEGHISPNGDLTAWLLGVKDRGALSLVPAPGYRPTACAFLPNGDLLVLERGTTFLAFTMQIRRIPAASIQPKARLDGTTILSGAGGDIDNMEALAVRQTEGGSVRIVIMSDDNFNDWERTLLLEFELPGE